MKKLIIEDENGAQFEVMLTADSIRARIPGSSGIAEEIYISLYGTADRKRKLDRMYEIKEWLRGQSITGLETAEDLADKFKRDNDNE